MRRLRSGLMTNIFGLIGRKKSRNHSVGLPLFGVAVETNDQGPFAEDVWWHLASEEKVVTYPSEATGASEMLLRLQKIPTL